jgi:hypothetical protein
VFARPVEAHTYAETSHHDQTWWVADLALPDDDWTSVGFRAAPIPGIDTDRMSRALSAAHDAFWAVIVGMFTEVDSGDLDPIETTAMEQGMTRALWAWLSTNHPTQVTQD